MQKFLIMFLFVILLFSTFAIAGTAFYKDEYIKGNNKICVYSYLSNEIVIVVRSVDLCPMTLEVDSE